MTQPTHSNSNTPARPLTAEQETQVAAGVMVHRGPRTPEQRERDQNDRRERQDGWQGIKDWFSKLF